MRLTRHPRGFSPCCRPRVCAGARLCRQHLVIARRLPSSSLGQHPPPTPKSGNVDYERGREAGADSNPEVVVFGAVPKPSRKGVWSG